MYKSFYSLTTTPFTKSILPEKAFRSSAFTEALARLDYVKRTKGIGLLLGEPGAGKTFALRTFSASLSPSLYHVMYFPLSTGTVLDFYKGLAYGLGEEPKTRKVDLFRQIQQGIERLYRERKVTPVFILDEIHMAKDVFLMDLSLLFNFAMDSENPFILLLCGLPHLRERLGLNQNRPLVQRIVMRYKIEALSKEEVAAYVNHQLEESGAKHPIFTESALEAVSTRTQGWPRLVNQLAIHCLLQGYALKKAQIDEDVVRLAEQEIWI